MLKEQNVIKHIIIVTIFFLSNQLYCQKQIVGRYSSLMLNQEHYNYFDFNKNGIFEYHSGASLGDDKFGKGHYQIKNDSLILKYDLTELKVNGFHKYRTYTNSSDSIQLKISVFDTDKTQLSRVNVYNTKSRYGELVNDKGIAYLKFKRDIGNIKIEASDLCCGNYSFLIDTKYNYKIDVFLRKKPNSIAIKDEIEKYKIVEYKDDFIKLKSKNGIIKLVKQPE